MSGNPYPEDPRGTEIGEDPGDRKGGREGIVRKGSRTTGTKEFLRSLLMNISEKEKGHMAVLEGDLPKGRGTKGNGRKGFEDLPGRKDPKKEAKCHPRTLTILPPPIARGA
jgi:hypothetical protein